MERSAKKYLLILAGSIALVLGLIGIVIPVLPTTPLLLLASYCYVRSSKRLYDWMLNNRFFGHYIYYYLTYRAIKASVKVATLILLWLTLAVSIVFVSNIYLRVLLVAVGVGVSIHILSLKTLRRDDSCSAADARKCDDRRKNRAG